MSKDSDPGIDKLKILSEITNASAPPPAPPAPSVDRPPSVTRKAVEPPVAPLWFRHRGEIAALVAAFVGMVWLAAGIAQKAWGPSLTGVGFGVASLAIWTLEVWSSD